MTIRTRALDAIVRLETLRVLGLMPLGLKGCVTIRTRALDAIVRLETLRVLDVETLRVLGLMPLSLTLEENCESRFAEAL